MLPVSGAEQLNTSQQNIVSGRYLQRIKYLQRITCYQDTVKCYTVYTLCDADTAPAIHRLIQINMEITR